ncbi:MAG: lipocalin-like protein [Mucilaginibacter sp.]|nr:lipocalin-like protein [Mucilaginibacter sp.]
MRTKIGLVIIAVILLSCKNKANKTESKEDALLPIVGTWQLISGTTIQKKDTVVTDYTKNQKAIKIINGTHFCFLIHDLTKGKGASPVFSVGGGNYTLVGDKYTEDLEYCNDRQWENHKFDFTVTINNDTLTQKGIEKIDSLGVNRINIEKYIRVKGS